MQLARIALAIAIVSLIGGCTHDFAKRDELCEQFARFANASQDNELHAVELLTDWGSQFSQDKNALYTQECKHHGYEPGSRLCEYLMGHTSIEFAEYNLARAQACLWPGTRGGPSATDYENLIVEAWSREASGVNENVHVGLSFNSGQGKSAPILKFLARREGTP